MSIASWMKQGEGTQVRNQRMKGSCGLWQTGEHRAPFRRQSSSRFSNTMNHPDKMLADGLWHCVFPDSQQKKALSSLQPPHCPSHRKDKKKIKKNLGKEPNSRSNPSVQVGGCPSCCHYPLPLPVIGSCFSSHWLQAWPCYLLWPQEDTGHDGCHI